MSSTAASLPTGVRERLIEAADRLFYQRGLHVGINEIVSTAGVAKTSLYLHFSSKDDLVAEYLSCRTSGYIAAWRAQLAATAGRRPHERLDAIFDVLRRFVESDGYRGCPYVNAAAELPDPNHPGYQGIFAYRAFVREELFAAVAIDAGVVDPAAVCAELQVVYDGSLAGAVIEMSAAPVERARAIAHTLLRAAAGDAVPSPRWAGDAVP